MNGFRKVKSKVLISQFFFSLSLFKTFKMYRILSLKSYVLDHSDSIYMQIEKFYKKIKLWSETCTSALGLLTGTDSCIRIMLLKTWQMWKNHTQAKLLQGFWQQVTWLTLLGGNKQDHVYLNGNMYRHWSENMSDLFTVITV